VTTTVIESVADREPGEKNVEGREMKLTKLLVPVIMAGAIISLPVALCAAPQQNTAQASSAASAAAPNHTWTTEQAVTSSVREAWALGGRTPEGFFEIVKVLTEISAQKRGLAIPENEQSGVRAGNWIKRQAKKDPDQLLYVIVDHAVQFSAKRVAGK